MNERLKTEMKWRKAGKMIKLQARGDDRGRRERRGKASRGGNG